MKKLIVVAVSIMLTSFTVVSAEIGVNIGVSAQVGTMKATGTEKSTDAARADSVTKEQEALFASGSFFVEKELSFLPSILGRLSIGYDNMAHDLDLGTATNYRNIDFRDKSVAVAANPNVNSSNNSVSATVDGFETIYLTANITDWLYVKAGQVSVDIKTNEKLETGGIYDDASLDGTLIGFGIHHEAENGMFVRLEYNDYSIDGATLTNKGTDSTRSVIVSDVDGTTGRISIGKAF
ncbi:hypothetical protein ABXT63_01430 [Candidatus Pelagibacter sp. Uisw_092]|jgi:hypothetical protein|uniref:hypothetical protein n=1 Tax=Candidatus Pelagibacter sp. Uisw_092 TaxID=3230979 RepID=UPI0039E76972